MNTEKKIIPVTLVQVYNPREVLLGLKKRGFGSGLWNGFGGKPEPGETMMQAALRELKQEAGIEGLPLKAGGTMTISFEGDEGRVIEIHLYRLNPFFGPSVETEEMRGQWFMRDAIPFEKMWPNDPLWVPKFLEGEQVEAHFVLDSKGERVVSHEIRFFKSEFEMPVK